MKTITTALTAVLLVALFAAGCGSNKASNNDRNHQAIVEACDKAQVLKQKVDEQRNTVATMEKDADVGWVSGLSNQTLADQADAIQTVIDSAPTQAEIDQAKQDLGNLEDELTAAQNKCTG